MKFRHLLLTVGVARLTFLALKHGQYIKKQDYITSQHWQAMVATRQNIQQQLAIVQSYRQPIEEMRKDFQYKSRVYRQSISGNVAVLREITKRYSSKEK